MRICRNAQPLPPTPEQGVHRRHGRLRCRDVSCSFGEVLDLSAGGMRVRGPIARKFQEGATLEIEISAPPLSIRLPARIVWIRRTGWRAGELGLMFPDPSPDSRTQLAELARLLAAYTSMLPLDRAA